MIDATTIARWHEPDNARGDDHELALLARTDPLAFAALYDRYLPAVHAYCYRRLGSREGAEDATAMIFMSALRAIGRYRADAPSFRAWLFTIAHHTVVDQLRARRWERQVDDQEVAATPAPGSGPDAVAIAAVELAAVRALLGGLPPERARMIELRLAGLNDKEIAHALGRSHGSVRVAIHRTLVYLRQHLRAEDGRDA